MTARAENLDVACLMDALLTCGCDGVREKLHISEDIKNICNIPKDLNAAFKSKPKFKTATSQAVDSGMKMLLLRFFCNYIFCVLDFPVDVKNNTLYSELLDGIVYNASFSASNNLLICCYNLTKRLLDHYKPCKFKETHQDPKTDLETVSAYYNVASANLYTSSIHKHLSTIIIAFLPVACTTKAATGCEKLNKEKTANIGLVDAKITDWKLDYVFLDDHEFLKLADKNTKEMFVGTASHQNMSVPGEKNMVPCSAAVALQLALRALACAFRVNKERLRNNSSTNITKFLKTNSGDTWNYAYVSMYGEYLKRIHNSPNCDELLTYTPYFGVYAALFEHIQKKWAYYSDLYDITSAESPTKYKNLQHLQVAACFDFDVRVIMDQYIHLNHIVGPGYKGGEYYCIINDFLPNKGRYTGIITDFTAVDFREYQPGLFPAKNPVPKEHEKKDLRELVNIGPCYNTVDVNIKTSCWADRPVDYGLRVDPESRYKDLIQNYSHTAIAKNRFFLTEEPYSHVAINTQVRLNPFVEAHQETKSGTSDVTLARGRVAKTLVVYHDARYKYTVDWHKNEAGAINKEIACMDRKFKDVQTTSHTNFKAVFDYRYQSMKCITSMLNVSSMLRMNINTRAYTFGGSGVGKTSFLFGTEVKADEDAAPSIINSVIANMPPTTTVQYYCHEIYGVIDDSTKKYLVAELEQTNSIPMPAKMTIHVIDHRLDDNGTLDPQPQESATSVTDNKLVFSDDRWSALEKSSNSSAICKTIAGLNAQVGVDRKNEAFGLPRRIRETRNNPESSRSILVYTFRFISASSVCTYFQVVDLMGYEDFEKEPAPINTKAKTELQLLCREGQFIRYSIAMSLKHCKVSKETDNILFNFPASSSDHPRPNTLKNLGIYIVNNTGANLAKTDLLYQASDYGRAYGSTAKPDEIRTKITRNTHERKHSHVRALDTTDEKSDGKAKSFILKTSYGQIKFTDKVSQLIDSVPMNSAATKTEMLPKAFASVLLLQAALKNAQVGKYFKMQAEQREFLAYMDKCLS